MRVHRIVIPIMLVSLFGFHSVFADNAMLEVKNGHQPHGHDGHGSAGLELDHGKQWKTDAPLRTGMNQVRTLVAGQLRPYHDKLLTKKMANRLAQSIEEQVAFMVKNCKLDPRADATLHAILAQILGGASVIRENPLSPDGLPVILSALKAYPRYFEHPGWVQIEAE